MLEFFFHEEPRFHSYDPAALSQSSVSQFSHKPGAAASIDQGMAMNGDPLSQFISITGVFRTVPRIGSQINSDVHIFSFFIKKGLLRLQQPFRRPLTVAS